MFPFCPSSHHPHKSRGSGQPRYCCGCSSCHAVPAAGFARRPAAVFTFWKRRHKAGGGLGYYWYAIFHVQHHFPASGFLMQLSGLLLHLLVVFRIQAKKSVVSCSRTISFFFSCRRSWPDPADAFLTSCFVNSHAVHKT